MSEINLTEVAINGEIYVKKSAIAESVKTGSRAVLVLDRGWIIAGDVETIDGRLKVTRAVHVRGWDSIGFDGTIANPKDAKVRIKPIPNGFDCPADAEIFRVPVEDSWGL